VTPRVRRGQWALVAAALFGGCQRGVPPPHVDAVRVVEGSLTSAAAEVGLDGPVLEAAGREALRQAGFRLEPGGDRRFLARLELASVRMVASQRGTEAEVSLEIELAALHADEPARRERGRGRAPLVEGGPRAASTGAARAALLEAARGLWLGLAAEARPTEALLRDLDDGDARVRDHAVRALADRRDPASVPALIRRLQDPDPEVAHRAVGALAQIRDRRAVPAIIDLSRGADATLTLRLVRIVGDMGGLDAEGWLATLAEAHPDPRVRAAAAETLSELQRAREDQAAGK
jgi:hypothetical protein